MQSGTTIIFIKEPDRLNLSSLEFRKIVGYYICIKRAGGNFPARGGYYASRGENIIEPIVEKAENLF